LNNKYEAEERTNKALQEKDEDKSIAKKPKQQ
jgi:hypothetical protein